MAWIRACGGGAPAIPDGKTVTPINDVTIWQKCGGIASPTYTTLSEVLADTGILSMLIASDNAIDYLVRSTTFASDVCADSNAMTYIGQNNYASNTLLADSDWCDAIVNSTYFESVLNDKVPAMTSQNTPSGEATANRTFADYYAWRAFNGNFNSQGWLGGYSAQTNETYLQYQFDTDILPKKISVTQQGCYDVNATIKGSNDGTNFTDLGTITFANRSVRNVVLPSNTTRYKYIRFVGTGWDNAGSSYSYYGYKAQIYGRKDV